MNYRIIVLFLCGVLTIAGCAAKAGKEQFPTVFYPDAPELARIQFLTSYTGSKDIEAPKSAFDAFVTGEKGRETRLDKPYGAAVYGGKIYVCDTNQSVMVFDLEKKTFGPLQGAQGMGKLTQPLNIFIDSEGNKYVADPVRGQVVMFDAKDFYVKAFGTPGGWKPTDVVVFDGKVYVTDAQNSAVVVFDQASEELIKKIEKSSDDAGDTPFVIPTNLSWDKDGYLYVSDVGRFQILKLDRDGHLARIYGRLGTNLGHFARPRGVAVDREGRVYAVDAAFDVVQIFDNGGQLLLFFGKPGKKPGELYLPAKVAIDYDNVRYFQQYADPRFEIEYLILVVNQFGDRMVNVFGFGKERGKKYPTEEELKKDLEERMKKMQKEEVKKDEKPGGGQAQ